MHNASGIDSALNVLCNILSTRSFYEGVNSTTKRAARYTPHDDLAMPISATLLIVLVLPLQSFNTANWSQYYMPYAWILALLTGSYLITRLLPLLLSYFTKHFADRQLLVSRSRMIRQLDFEEKAVLREFVIRRKNVLSLSMSEPTISNLMRAGVLVPAFETQEIKGSSRIIKLSIAIEAREHLTHKVLGFPAGKLTEEEAVILKAARLEYARGNYIAL